MRRFAQPGGSCCKQVFHRPKSTGGFVLNQAVGGLEGVKKVQAGEPWIRVLASVESPEPSPHCRRFALALSNHQLSDSSFRCTGVKKLSTTKSATSRPSRWPVLRSKRTCCPAKIRLNVASSAAAEKLVNERSTPVRAADGTVKSKCS